MSHEFTIRKLHDLFNVGCFTERRDLHNEHYKLMYLWAVSTVGCRAVLDEVRPYLVTKAHEADLAYEFLNLPRSGTRLLPDWLVQERHRLFLALKEAKK